LLRREVRPWKRGRSRSSTPRLRRTSSRPLVAPVRVNSVPRTAVFCEGRAGESAPVVKRRRSNRTYQARVELVKEGGETLEEGEVTLVEVALEDVVKTVGGTGKGTLDAENGSVLCEGGGGTSEIDEARRKKGRKTNEAGVQLVEERSEALKEGKVALLDATLAEDIVEAVGSTGEGELGTENGGVLREGKKKRRGKSESTRKKEEAERRRTKPG
jgi:hypothetical protein